MTSDISALVGLMDEEPGDDLLDEMASTLAQGDICDELARRTYTKPTAVQQEVLDATRAYWSEHGKSPTLKELGAMVGKTKCTVRRQLIELRGKGLVTYYGHRTRGIELVTKEQDPAPSYKDAVESRWATVMAGAIIRRAGDGALLIGRQRGAAEGQYSVPMGQVIRSETPMGTAVRALYEQTKLVVDKPVLLPLVTYDAGDPDVANAMVWWVFGVASARSTPVLGKPELCHSWEWVTPENRRSVTPLVRSLETMIKVYGFDPWTTNSLTLTWSR